MKRVIIYFVITAAISSLVCIISCDDTIPASMVIINGTIWNGEKKLEGSGSIAVRDDKIIWVGPSGESERYISSDTEIIDAGGRLVLPGFIDSHLHFIEGGFRLSSVKLRDAETPEEFIKRIKRFAENLEPGTWITGGDWDHEQWGGELPGRDWIDSVTKQNPVWINRLDGHMSLANSVALDLAGVTGKTENVAGGVIVRYENNEPTGILKDNAMYLVDKIVPEPADELYDSALNAAMDYVISKGVTSVHHMGRWKDLEVFERARRNNQLKTRIYASVPLSTWEKLKTKIEADGKGDNWLKIGGLKGFADGSLGSHTAAFFEPYEDQPDNSGVLVTDKQDLYENIKKGDGSNLQAVIHAIGDRAISDVLDIFEKVAAENGQRDRRFRIEHSQHINPKDFLRFRELNVIASMQPYHAIDDGRWAEKVIGSERIKTTYAFKKLLQTGVRLAFGSDWYVAPPDPLFGIYAAVTRRTLDDENPEGWVPEERISVEAALRAYTSDAAFASFDENNRGRLKEGFHADIIILNEDIFDIDPEMIKEVKILKTILGGKEVFSR
jgi:predicted amidohydrolase YtcJ